MSGDSIAASAGQAARKVSQSPWLERAARVGFVVSGVLHLLIAYIAVQVAWTRPSAKADQSGALSLLAHHGWGEVVLWVGVVGFAALGVWQVTEALLPRVGDVKEQLGPRAKALAKGVVYLVLAVSTLSFARGSGSSSSKQSRDFTASLMSHSGGRVLVVCVGLAVIGVGGYHVYKGVTKKFRQDLVGNPGAVVEHLALAGYVAKGIALGIVGVLFCIAGARQQPSKATGLDGALRTLREQPLGGVLLTLVALGLAAYGLYSFARARRARF
ncbi:DUF1206 domain-containing protein [Angustibacter sp. Root456]|uniref:DUF1206 domain-containing protein n=1 Tax=Angustibacter sp. Root456 TaxID=1736539 RepID=UPI000A741FE6|nr:DUF1206 domain-containing protein [Angustibacter sp. Root456]